MIIIINGRKLVLVMNLSCMEYARYVTKHCRANTSKMMAVSAKYRFAVLVNVVDVGLRATSAYYDLPSYGRAITPSLPLSSSSSSSSSSVARKPRSSSNQCRWCHRHCKLEVCGMLFSIPNSSHFHVVIHIPDIYTLSDLFPFPYYSRKLIPTPSHSRQISYELKQFKPDKSES